MFKRNAKPDPEPLKSDAHAGHACCGGAGGCSSGEPHDQSPGENAGAPGGPSSQIEALITERDDAISKYRYALADFQNYQRRSIENEREARRQGVTSVLQSIIPVLDHFDLALGHKTDNPEALQVIEGVRVIREELLKSLGSHGVSVINPAANDELDPHRHQAVVHQHADGIAPGHISMTLQVGYALADRVIRPAKVAVEPGT